jgi:hypothetical protein
VVKDWYSAVTHYINNYSNLHLSYDNGVNVFLASNSQFRGVFVTNDILGEMVLVIEDVFWETEMDEEDAVIMFLVPTDNQMTWEELKEYCSNDTKPNTSRGLTPYEDFMY